MHHPIYGLPFDTPIAEALQDEFEARPFAWRLQALRKAAGRELELVLNGQQWRRVNRVPTAARSMLWIHTWTTVGDAVMDLAPRRLLPAGLAVDLLIASPLAPLFKHDRRFRAIYTCIEDAAGEFDFVLLDALSSASLRLKARHLPRPPFASMRGHQAGERFDRVAFADRRIRQLFALPDGEVVTPALSLGARMAWPERRCIRIAVPLGARVEVKRYRHWNTLLGRLVSTWPADLAPPHFVLIGTGAAALSDLAALNEALVADHSDVLLDSGDLHKTALDIAACDAFLGVDGGLMHIAVAVGTPGLALFADIEPAYFLRPGSSMQALRSAGEVSLHRPDAVAAAFMASLPRQARAAATSNHA